MRIDKVRWRNFTSWGNSWHEMSFAGPAGLSLICGVNGSGKSQIANLIIYMLYGQLDGFTQKDIPNRINRHFEGEIFFTSRSREGVIRRSLAPNGFSVTIDGEAIDVAGKNNIQKWLEEEIYGIPYAVFRNSIILSVNDFKSFAALSPKEKRDIIDRLFGYQTINTASAKVKDALKKTNVEIAGCESAIAGYEASVREIESTIRETEKPKKDTAGEYDIEEINETLRANAKQYKKITETVENLKKSDSEIKKKKTEISGAIDGMREKIKLYESGICPQCGSDLRDDRHAPIRESLEKELADAETEYSSLREKETGVSSAYSDAISEKNGLAEKISGLKIEKAKAEAAAEERRRSDSEQLEKFAVMRENIRKRIGPYETELAKLRKKADVLNIVNDIFSETGLKQYISNIYVPLINAYVTDVCEKLGVPYRVSFTTGYDCVISFMGDPIPYTTMSTGERKKIDIAITLAFLKIIKTKISDINILFLDEVLSSIDVGSCNEMLRIFADFAKEGDFRIYMIHHANLDSTWVDGIIEIEKRNGFSRFV